MRGVFPVNKRGRNRGRISAFHRFLVSTSAFAASAFAATALLAASACVAQTAPQSGQAGQAGKDENKLPRIDIAGKRLKPPQRVKKPGASSLPAPRRTAASGSAKPAAATGPSAATGLSAAAASPLNTNVVAASASRLGLTVRETPATVEVVDQQTIRDEGYRTTTESAQGAVGVLSGDSAGAPAGFSMRGFTYGAVNVLYNGISIGPQDITSRVMDTANLQQIEFLKGPSSLMSGLDAIGGSVNYVSRQPTSGPVQNETDVSLDSLNTFRSHFGSGGSTPVQGLDYRFDMSESKINSFIDGDFQGLTDLSAQFNYRATDVVKTFVAIEYKKDSGHAYWGTPLVPTSFAGSHAVGGVVSGTAVNTFDGSIIGSMTIDSRTLTTNYNVADNSTGAEELWLRSGYEWTPLNNVTVKNQAYYYQAQRHWIDSETYAFDLATSTIDRDRFFVTHNQHVVGDNTDVVWNARLFGMENRLAAQLQLSRNWITFTKRAIRMLIPMTRSR